jgi:nucleoside-diphosphate-sugar epimerase
MAKKHRILIAGAGGVVGSAAVEHFASLPDWQVVALSRRRLALPEDVEHVSVDLTDAAACRRALRHLPGTTHLLYAALYEKPDLVAGWRDPEQMAINERMLRNALDALEESAPGLRHVTILQGTKAYGGHVEPAPVPCKERWPRHPHENFYWLQEDLLRERQPKRGWTFSILRPQIVLGYAVSSPMNIIGAIGAYASVLRELGRPLSFPGGGRFINAASDSRLIARAAEFTGTHEIAANESYNVVNGDMLVWQDIWQSIAARFGMEVGAPVPMRLADEMPAFEEVWARVVGRHGLRELTLEALVGSSWQFTDRAFAHGLETPADSVLSGIKLRQHGFHVCFDTEDAVHHWLAQMQSQRLLPH